MASHTFNPSTYSKTFSRFENASAILRKTSIAPVPELSTLNTWGVGGGAQYPNGMGRRPGFFCDKTDDVQGGHHAAAQEASLSVIQQGVQALEVRDGEIVPGKPRWSRRLR